MVSANRQVTMISPSQCRAARGLVGISQQELAEAAKVGLSTVRNFEAGRSVPVANNLDAIARSLEAAGAEFIPENGGGSGVRWKKRARSDHPKPSGPATDVVDAMDAAIEKDRRQ